MDVESTFAQVSLQWFSSLRSTRQFILRVGTQLVGAASMTTHHSQREDDLATLTAGSFTGWWDEHGQPAPWPDDLLPVLLFESAWKLSGCR
jgi:hypothetical protein